MLKRSRQLRHVQSQAPGSAPGAVDPPLNLLLIRRRPARRTHGQHGGAQERENNRTRRHDTQKKEKTNAREATD